VDSGRGAHEGESSMPLCGRSQDRTRARSPRQLPTDHDYAARPANIRLINRRDSFLDRYPRHLRYRKKEKPPLVVDRSFHIRGGARSARVTPTKTPPTCLRVRRLPSICTAGVPAGSHEQPCATSTNHRRSDHSDQISVFRIRILTWLCPHPPQHLNYPVGAGLALPARITSGKTPPFAARQT
jgi:hypothetical protein